MARIVEFHSSEQPHMSMSEALNYRLAEPLVYRDLDGVLADIPAACCRRCGEVTLRSDKVGNHLCTTQSRTDRLVERGMEAFHAVVSRNDQLAATERIAALEAALSLAERETKEPSPWVSDVAKTCRICDQVGLPMIDHAPDCPFAALAGSQGGGGDEGQG